MIENRHFRDVEARRRTIAEAIDRYFLEELPAKRDSATRRSRLLWWKHEIGHLKLAEVSAETIVEARNKLLREPYVKAKPGAPGSTLAEGEAPREFKRSASTVNRFLAYLGHVFTIARREWHWLTVNPMLGVSKYKEGDGRENTLSQDQRARLLKETTRDAQLPCW